MPEHKVHPNLVYNFMDNMRMKDFLIIGVDEDGDAMMTFRSFSDERHRKLKELVCKWYMEMELADAKET